MRRLVAVAAVLAACGSRTPFQSATPPLDAAPPPDAPRPPVECARPSDCSGSPMATHWCTGSASWSCVAGRCTWECGGGRTCALDAAGCMDCGADGGTQCPATPCVFDVVGTRPRIEEATCQRAFLVDAVRCFGGYVELRDGTFCTLAELPTGALRYVLACGPCHTVVTP